MERFGVCAAGAWPARAEFKPFYFNGWSGARGSRKCEAHDGPVRLAARDLLEARVVVHGFCPEPQVFILGTGRLVDRIDFQERAPRFLA
jgi:hypothetical protein